MSGRKCIKLCVGEGVTPSSRSPVLDTRDGNGVVGILSGPTLETQAKPHLISSKAHHHGLWVTGQLGTGGS